jgi:hypothetical protein
MKRTIIKTERKGVNAHTVTVTLGCGHTLTFNSRKRKLAGRIWCWKCARPLGANPAGEQK